MPLYDCPNMAAKCPHHDNDCENKKISKNCLHVKNTTRSTLAAFVALNQIKEKELGSSIPDLNADTQIAEIVKFFKDTVVLNPEISTYFGELP